MSDKQSADSSSGSSWSAEDKKWALLAGKAAFALELYIFKSVLPSAMIKPYVFPRNIPDMEAEIAKAARSERQENSLEDAAIKWAELQARLGWKNDHIKVLSIAKQSYLKVNPSPDIVKKVNAESSSPLDLHRAFEHVLMENLQAAGREVAQIVVGLRLSEGHQVKSVN